MTGKTCKLSDLGLMAVGGRNPDVTGLTSDNRKILPGMLFVALSGTRVHGATFAEAAIKAGASAILTDQKGFALIRDLVSNVDVALCISDDPRQTYALAASLWFEEQPATMMAVTGTNGKTSVATFIRQIWQHLGHAAINLGTTGVEGDFSFPLAHTTPEPVVLHCALAAAVRAGVTCGAMEASSHGLDQRRLDGVRIQVAGFTNFTQDHLDYHETFEAYFAAKARLFDEILSEDGVAVLNMDDERSSSLMRRCYDRGIEVLTVGYTEAADLHIIGQRFENEGQTVRFAWHDEKFQVQLPLIGAFQAQNVLLAAVMVIASGEDPRAVFEALPHLTTVRGRMQLAAQRTNGASVFVDYAHTPDAVQTALRAFRPHVMGRLIAIIGAGGDRDKGKRPLMGAAAEREADIVIITDDNPRSEQPEKIRNSILSGFEHPSGALVIADRAEAILRAIDMLKPGDGLLITGKGHETGQIIGDTVYPFDDVEQASLAVSALDGLTT